MFKYDISSIVDYILPAIKLNQYVESIWCLAINLMPCKLSFQELFTILI